MADQAQAERVSRDTSSLQRLAQTAVNLAYKLEQGLGELPEFYKNEELVTTLYSLQSVVADISASTLLEVQHQASFQMKQEDLQTWSKVGSGGFSSVFTAKHKGSLVAVKVLKHSVQGEGQIIEGRLLRSLSHDNIVAFRGMGNLSHSVGDITFDSQTFIVMEYIPDTVRRYVTRRSNYESKGLSPSVVWDFGRQIASGLAYLHTLSTPLQPIAHRDLKPDNLLLDSWSLKIKLADFGLALSDIYGGENLQFNVRWASPEIWEDLQLADEGDFKKEFPTEYFMASDVFAYGMVLAFCLTGDLPWGNTITTKTIDRSYTYTCLDDIISLPGNLPNHDPLKKLIAHCIQRKDEGRPYNAEEIANTYFQDPENPYLQGAASAEFFCCGFMKDTSIFVADSLVDEDSQGYFTSGAYPKGYPEHCLTCKVDTTPEEGCRLPSDNWAKLALYGEKFAHFQQKALDLVIDNNPTLPLRSLVTSREGEEEEQEIKLTFAQGTYVHHRAMRDVWMSLTDEEKRIEVPIMMSVHPAYSTSFGLHVAVITADVEPRFLFCRRSKREGMSSPGKYTCGAVESVSVKDHVTLPGQPGETYVSLLKTAARGLFEELHVEIQDHELSAIHLSTIYLKYDTHEWGLCGFVDLSDKHIAPERRLTCEALRSRFTSGPKDKFEHKDIHDVDFKMDSMMMFIQANQNDFASSGKLVAVKVMQAFFGLRAVEQAFSAALSPV